MATVTETLGLAIDDILKATSKLPIRIRCTNSYWRCLLMEAGEDPEKHDPDGPMMVFGIPVVVDMGPSVRVE